MKINFTEHSRNDCTVFLDGNIMATGLRTDQAEVAVQLMRLTAEKCGAQVESSFDSGDKRILFDNGVKTS